VEDGLIGYFNKGAYNRIVAPLLADRELSKPVKATNYVLNPKVDGLRVGFGAPEKLTLLMDPWGSVQAACGLVPAKTITLANQELNKMVTRMEISFRVGPVLVPVDRVSLPTPTGKAAAVVAVDPKSFTDQPIVAAEGRLVLLNEE
jgi:hypothetical protein